MIDGGQYRWRKGAPAGQVVFVDEAQKAAFKEAPMPATQITVDENIPFKVSSSGTLKHLRVVSGNNDRFVVQRALNLRHSA